MIFALSGISPKVKPPRMVAGCRETCQPIHFGLIPASHQPRRFSFVRSARNGRVDNDPESGSCHGKIEPRFTPRVSSELSERYRYSFGDIGDTSAKMNRISASCVAWGFVDIQGLGQVDKVKG